MRKLILILTFCIFQVFNVFSQSNIKVLENSYKKGFVSKGKDSIRYQKDFFNSFPSNFKSFENIYGWNKKADKAGPLYDISFDHINHFFRLQCIDENTFTAKIIHIAINGIWDADGVGIFQHNLMWYVKSHHEKFIRTLQTFKKQEIISLWTFYFDYENSFDRKKDYINTLKLIPLKDKAMKSFIASGYEEASKRNPPH